MHSLTLSLLAQKLFFLLCFLCLQDLSLFLSRFLLLLQGLLFRLIRLGFVNCLYEHPLVFVSIALGMAVEEVVEVLVDLLLLTVLAQQPTKYSLTTHPQHLCWHTGFSSSTALPNTSVSPLTLSIQVLSDTRPRMHLHCFTDN